MSAINVNKLGVVDPAGKFVVASNEDDGPSYENFLHAYVYEEGVAGCGGDAVSSLLFKNLKESGLIDPTKGPAKLLVAAFDNCAGQNKNNFVLRMLCLYLVEKGFFEKVIGLFLVKGHTQNPCDHGFNTLKKDYRKQNLETFQELMVALNRSDNVGAYEVKEADFFGWGALLEKLYKRFPAVEKYQLFSSDGNEKVTMHLSSNAAADDSANLRFPVKESAASREERLKELTPHVLISPGLKDIKKVELYTKFRSLLQEKNRDITCPHPGDEVLNSIKSQRQEKAKKRAHVQKGKIEKQAAFEMEE